MKIEDLDFKTIDLLKNESIAIKFREDSFIASFGNADRFYESDGQGHIRYIQWLKEKISSDPRFAVHVRKSSEIIGQLELGLLKSDNSIGYVNLYYLKPEYRGKGYSMALDQYVMNLFSTLKKEKIRLSVSLTNTRALRYYEKMGWRDLGPRSDHPEVNFMEKNISP